MKIVVNALLGSVSAIMNVYFVEILSSLTKIFKNKNPTFLYLFLFFLLKKLGRYSYHNDMDYVCNFGHVFYERRDGLLFRAYRLF